MPESLPPTIWENHRLDWGRQTHVMGIINITPDSFAGDGLVENTLTQEEIVQQAVAQDQTFVAGGATLIDVGGESTRPHAASVPLQQELARALPWVRALYPTLPNDIMIPIDTYKSAVARGARDAG